MIGTVGAEINNGQGSGARTHLKTLARFSALLLHSCYLSRLKALADPAASSYSSLAISQHCRRSLWQKMLSGAVWNELLRASAWRMAFHTLMAGVEARWGKWGHRRHSSRNRLHLRRWNLRAVLAVSPSGVKVGEGLRSLTVPCLPAVVLVQAQVSSYMRSTHPVKAVQAASTLSPPIML